jgi:quercetin dioxygenase-like cupin family protein
MVTADPYKVKHVEPLLKSNDVLARIFTLAPGDTIPWHYHQHCADHFFVLEGVLSISTREPALTRKLSVGQSYKIAWNSAFSRQWRQPRLPLFSFAGCWDLRLESGRVTRF